MIYSVIMAGGIGSRFWPQSREARPKQFIRVFGERSLIQQTLSRMTSIVPPERTMVVTHERYVALATEQLPEIPEKNILGEPISRNTAPCIAYAAIKLLEIDPDAVMVVLPSDHLIKAEDRFIKILHKAVDMAKNSGALVTIGIQPSYPATGYGYIQYDRSAHESNGIYPVRTFAEKPNEATAERFLDSGDFLWNSGIFIWRADSILSNLQLYLRSTWAAFQDAYARLGTDQEADAIRQAYHKSARISIDVGVMERASNVYVVPGNFGWSDIGDWRAVYDLSEKNRHGNVLKGNVIIHNSSRCLVNSGKRLIAIVGLHDTVVVDTDDALLICHQNSTQQVKNVVDYLHVHQHKDFV
ncbi:MAG: mannose-1-phosphate guanylyltransferase [Bacteroidetes bacterium]|nr:mannose-1-phosphate guanylyltransferase [Bacteroidota bacterium]MCY4205494.1 mannose-1-phosphate guanylyltransferase [Bacteroidota bacterium]